MKSTGIIRNVDGLGRIVLPKELRRSFGISTDTPLEILTDGDGIVLRPYQPAGSCAFCGEVASTMVAFRGKHVCAACLAELNKL